jgi:hypothetical protein
MTVDVRSELFRRPSDRRRRGLAAGLGAVVAAVLIAAGCAAPSGGTVVTQGFYDGEYSIISPVSYGYDGVAGQDLNLYFSDTRTGETSTPSLTLVAPGGGAVAATELRGSYTKRFILPVTGRYSIQLRYPDADTGVRRYLLAVSRDEDRGLTGTGRLGSVIAGQRVTYRYAGTAGERLNRYGVDRVVAPGGAAVLNNGIRSAQVTLPATGEYLIEVAGFDAVLSNDLPPVDVALGATLVPELLPGQHVDLRYPGTAGEALGIGASSSAYSVELRTPADAPFTPSSSRGTRSVLPAAGTHIVVVSSSPFAGPGTIIWLSNDLDLGVRGEGSWPADGRAPGQSFVVSYVGVAGQQVRLRTLDPPGLKPLVTLSAPSGSIVEGVTEPGYPSDPWTTYTLSETGTHRVLVVPASAYDQGPITLQIDDLP